MQCQIRVERMDHVAIDVTDLDRARAFYGELFGLKEIARPESFDFPGAWFETGSSIIHLVGRGRRDAEGKRHLCLWVSDVRSASAAVEAAGFPLIWEMHYKIVGVNRFFTADPDGNRIEVQGSDNAT